jgi:hypothetical protein
MVETPASKELTLGRIFWERKSICLSAPPNPTIDFMVPGRVCLISMGRSMACQVSDTVAVYRDGKRAAAGVD